MSPRDTEGPRIDAAVERLRGDILTDSDRVTVNRADLRDALWLISRLREHLDLLRLACDALGVTKEKGTKSPQGPRPRGAP